ncbi:hypothetical protein PFISCL1PPCAC_3210, partial [Pristionchus fissidentatus]
SVSPHPACRNLFNVPTKKDRLSAEPTVCPIDALFDEKVEYDRDIDYEHALDAWYSRCEKEQFFTMITARQDTLVFVQPFVPYPLAMKVTYPPRKSQIKKLKQRGFQHADYLHPFSRFKAIGRRCALDAPLWRQRLLLDIALHRKGLRKENDEAELKEELERIEREERE